MTSSISSRSIFPWATPKVTSGIIFCNKDTRLYKVAILLCKKNTWPFLPNSLSINSLTTSILKGVTYVWIGILSCGGVSILDILRTPIREICNVLGIGVAVNVKTSISFLSSLILSFCSTPNLCSSSIIKRPSSLKWTFLESKRCVPIIRWALPSSTCLRYLFCSLVGMRRENTAILTSKLAKRFNASS